MSKLSSDQLPQMKFETTQETSTTETNSERSVEIKTSADPAAGARRQSSAKAVGSSGATCVAKRGFGWSIDESRRRNRDLVIGLAVLFGVVPGVVMMLIPVLVLLPMLFLALVPIIAVFQGFIAVIPSYQKQRSSESGLDNRAAASSPALWIAAASNARELRSDQEGRQLNPLMTPAEIVEANHSQWRAAHPALHNADPVNSSGGGPSSIQEGPGYNGNTADGATKTDSQFTPFFAIFAVILVPVLSFFCVPIFFLLPLVVILTVPLMFVASTVFLLALPLVIGFAVFAAIPLLFFLPWSSMLEASKEYCRPAIQRCKSAVKQIGAFVPPLATVTDSEWLGDLLKQRNVISLQMPFGKSQ